MSKRMLAKDSANGHQVRFPHCDMKVEHGDHERHRQRWVVAVHRCLVHSLRQQESNAFFSGSSLTTRGKSPPSRTVSGDVEPVQASELPEASTALTAVVSEDAPVWWLRADIAVRRGRWWRLKASVRIFRP
jgi:hypothetical protein